jgi:hypothetical protein
MLKSQRILKVSQFVLCLALFGVVAHRESFATCTGADPCKACKDCKYCMHCAKQGGTCGICKHA